jgi:predicted nucleic acid-binding protein
MKGKCNRVRWRKILGTSQTGIYLLRTNCEETETLIPHYAEICANFETDNAQACQSFGQNDRWIAAVAKSQTRPLVMRNQRHFRTIAGLELVVLMDNH